MNDYDMTKEEALVAIKKGHKVTREYFSPEEYIYMDGNTLRFEDGVYVQEWWQKIEPDLNMSSFKCWAIWTEK